MGRGLILRGLIVIVGLILFPISALSNSASQRLTDQGNRALERDAYKEAMRLCEQAVVADPADASAFACLGRGHFKSGNKKYSDKYYKIALDIFPAHQSALRWGGESDITNGRPDKARKKLNRLKRVCGQCDAYQQLQKILLRYNAKKSSGKKNKP